jgi:hypothetical protein
MKCVEQTGAFFEPTLAALFVREAFGPSIQSAVCESLPLPATLYPFHPIHLALFCEVYTSLWCAKQKSGKKES